MYLFYEILEIQLRWSNIKQAICKKQNLFFDSTFLFLYRLIKAFILCLLIYLLS